MAEGTLYVISAASGAGKTSLVAAVLEQLNDIEVSVAKNGEEGIPVEDGRRRPVPRSEQHVIGHVEADSPKD